MPPTITAAGVLTADGWLYLEGPAFKKFVHPRGTAEARTAMGALLAAEDTSPLWTQSGDEQWRRIIAAFRALFLYFSAIDVSPLDCAPYAPRRRVYWPGDSDLTWQTTTAGATPEDHWIWGNPYASQGYRDATAALLSRWPDGRPVAEWIDATPPRIDPATGDETWRLEALQLPVDFGLNAAGEMDVIVRRELPERHNGWVSQDGGSSDAEWSAYRWRLRRFALGGVVLAEVIAPLSVSWALALATMRDVMARAPDDGVVAACAWIAAQNTAYSVASKHGDTSATPADALRLLAQEDAAHSAPLMANEIARDTTQAASLLFTIGSAIAAGAGPVGIVFAVIVGILQILDQIFGNAVGITVDCFGRRTPLLTLQAWRADMHASPPVPPTVGLGPRAGLPEVPDVGAPIFAATDPYTGRSLVAPLTPHARYIGSDVDTLTVGNHGVVGGGNATEPPSSGGGLGLLAALAALGFFL